MSTTEQKKSLRLYSSQYLFKYNAIRCQYSLTTIGGGLRVNTIRATAAETGSYFTSIPLQGAPCSCLRNLRCIDLLAYSCRRELAGGEALTLEWLVQPPEYVRQAEVRGRDGRVDVFDPNHLEIVSLDPLAARMPRLIKICLAPHVSGSICGAELTTEGDFSTCSLHRACEGEAAAARLFTERTMFYAWLREQRSVVRRSGGGELCSDGVTTCPNATGCTRCLEAKMKAVDAAITTDLAGYSRSQPHLRIAATAMFALYFPSMCVLSTRAPSNPMPGLCLALRDKATCGTGKQLCLKPAWEHAGKQRLVCMRHLVHAATDGRAGIFEEAILHHINNYRRHKRGIDLLPDMRCVNEHRDIPSFIKAMLKHAGS